jgi:hypothetical protein
MSLDVPLQTVYAIRQHALHYKYVYALEERSQDYKSKCHDHTYNRMEEEMLDNTNEDGRIVFEA